MKLRDDHFLRYPTIGETKRVYLWKIQYHKSRKKFTDLVKLVADIRPRSKKKYPC